MPIELSRRWFAFAWKYFAPISHTFLKRKKRELLKPLAEIVSNDPHLRELQAIRILEIGIARGSNFKYYPPKSRFVGVDVNKHFEKQLFKRLKDKDLVCEKLLHCPAECMKDIEDNTFDVVISTFVMCSVENPSEVVKEIKRVLTKGGKWFMFEHGEFQNRPLHTFLLTLSKPIFKHLGGGCTPDRKMFEIVNNGSFEKQDMKYDESTLMCMTVPLFAWYIGTVTK